jgi:hypothetical protein
MEKLFAAKYAAFRQTKCVIKNVSPQTVDGTTPLPIADGFLPYQSAIDL